MKSIIINVIDYFNFTLTNPEMDLLMLRRNPNKRCLSVQGGVIIKEVLLEFIRKKAFCEDYENITSLLLSEPVSYDEEINGISRIISSGLFD